MFITGNRKKIFTRFRPRRTSREGDAEKQKHLEWCFLRFYDTLKSFLAKFDISEKDFESTNLKWEDLQIIRKDYRKIKKELNLIARYIEEKLHTLDIVHSVRYRIKDSEHLLAKICLLYTSD